MRTRRQVILAACLAVVGAAGLYADHGDNADKNNGGQNNETRLRTSLTGAPINGMTAEGHADFRADDRGRTRLNLEVEHVNLPAGTVLTVSIVDGTKTTVVGTLKLSATDEGELELNSQDGQVVPAVQKGDMVVVSANGKRILAGVF